MYFRLIIFILFTSSISAQIITITDQKNGSHIELVALVSSTPPAYTVTNAKGQADISEFKNSECIDISSLGYGLINMTYAEIEKQNFNIQLNSNRLSITEVVISATKWNQLSNEVPARIVSVAPKEILFLQPQTSADLLNATGEVFIQKSQQGGGSPMIRGFATNRLLYAIDGVRMNTAISEEETFKMLFH